MRVLCLGNNTEHTDTLAQALAATANWPCHGLLSSLGSQCIDYQAQGYYHTSTVDIERSHLISMAKDFDQIVVLDQTVESYGHPNVYYNTIKLATDIAAQCNVIWQNADMKSHIGFFERLVKDNKSFCIFPFIELLTNNGHTTVCCRSSKPITKISQLTDFATDANYQNIRSKMLQGISVPEHCHTCYAAEDLGIISARQQETVEWANRLGLESLNDLEKITKPVYYEVRPSNVCNLQCRMCSPASSELINQEYFKLKLINQPITQQHSGFDIVDLDHIVKLYVAGGEPTAMPEFFAFLDQCIEQGRNFEFMINTNAAKLSDRFKSQLKKLPHVQFTISIDGYDKLNHYIRWPSNWRTVIDNAQYLRQQGHKICFNVTVSMYNVAELHELLSFFDQEFPGVLVDAHVATGITSPWNFPQANLVIEDAVKVRQLRCYQNNHLLASVIESIITQFSADSATRDCKKFLNFNRKLDQNRDVDVMHYATKLWQATKDIT